MANGTTGMMSTPAGGASATDINSTLKNIVTNIGQEAMAAGALTTTSASALLTLQGIATTLQSTLLAVQNIATAIFSTFPRIIGQFTLATNASLNGTTFVAQPAIHANGFPLWTPITGDAGIAITSGMQLQGVTAGSGFVIFCHGTTQGDEIFNYIVINP